MNRLLKTLSKLNDFSETDSKKSIASIAKVNLASLYSLKEARLLKFL
jgi:hypothetical protein